MKNSKGEKFLRQLVKSLNAATGIKETTIRANAVRAKNENIIKSSIALDRRTDIEYRNDYHKNIEEMFSQLDVSQARLNEGAKFGDALLYPVFKPMIARASRLARKSRLMEQSIGTIGILPIGTPNAMAIAVPNSKEHVVVFQRGLPLFLNRMAKIVLAVDGSVSIPDFESVNLREDGWEPAYTQLVNKALDKDKDFEARLLSLIIATLVYGDPNQSDRHDIPATLLLAKNELLYHMEFFIIGHEFGHIKLASLNRSSQKAHLPLGSVEAEVIMSNRADEIVADLTGFTITDLAIADRMGTGLEHLSHYAYAAPDFFFTCVIVLEDYMKLCGEKWSSADTHPAADTRRDLRRAFLDSVKERGGNVTAKRLQIIVDALSARIRPAFEDFVQSGHAISSFWKADVSPQQ